MDIFCWSMRCLLAGSWPSARHDQAQWLGTDKAQPARGRKKEALGCHALLLQVRGDWAWYKALFGFKGWASKDMCWRCEANCSGIPWTDTAAAWRTSRYRTSELLARQTEQGISVNPLFSLPRFSAELSCIDVLHSMDLGTTQDAIGHLFFDLVAGWVGTQHIFIFLHVCLRLCACVCVRLCSECTSSCALSPLQAPDSSARSRGAAELLSCGTRSNFNYKKFHTQSRLQKLTWEMIRVDQKPPKLRAKCVETRHLVPCCYELAMNFHKQQRSAHSLTVRGLFEQLFGLYMTMSVEPFDSAACARCSRQLCTLYKALSKEASDDNLWKLKPKMHMVQEMCEVQSELLGNPREFWTYSGRELHGRRFVHGALARWISDGFDDSSPCVGLTSRALAFIITCERAIGKKKKNWTQSRHICATPHMTPTPEDLDSLSKVGPKPMFSRSCAGHTIPTSGHQWSFWPGDRWRHVLGSRLHFYALSAIRIRCPSCHYVTAFHECSNHWLPRTRWNTHARWAAMLVSKHPISPPCH